MNKLTMISVSEEIAGLHYWDCAPKDVEFLKNSHRHMFHIILKIQVKHDDREIEFFQLKKWLKGVCSEIFSDTEPVRKSCEMFADDILTKAVIIYGKNRIYNCEVLEDNENGAIVNLTPEE